MKPSSASSLRAWKNPGKRSETWSWASLAQYDNVSEVLGFNSRVHWTPRSGRNAYLVVNVGREDRDRDRDFRPMNWEVALKSSHDLRF